MLTVACFMIQHGRYSDEALAWIAQKLCANLNDTLTFQMLSATSRSFFAG
jgi:hypothetical protein